MPLLIKCACIWSNLLELSTERVNRVTVWVVVPCVTSTTCTGILAGLDSVVGVVVGVTVGACPVAGVLVAVGDALGVPVAVAFPVAVAVGVGVVLVVGGPLAGSDVGGMLLSVARTSLTLGVTPLLNF